MFRRLPETGTAQAASCRFDFNGGPIDGYAGETVAAALLRADVPSFRVHPIDASPRVPYCMMGVCQECLVCVDGGAARRACLMPVAEGLKVVSATTKAGHE
jgi:predicted molibdopterin-dependent oxidoreductase YjgC